MNEFTLKVAKELRSKQTTAESILWNHLRSRQLNGRKWRRQQPLGLYMVDFLCFALRLIIEIDGDAHAGQEQKDTKRQDFLESQGFTLVRFTNDDVFNNPDGILQLIWGT